MLTSASNVSNNSSYSNDKGTGFDNEYAADAASGGFFHSDFKKHDDLKEMLDSNKDSLKLEAMKRIIGMVAKGRDASMLFPAVVKNVVSKNIEVKKLVYVYLERYAEEQQDLALLSISTFQRALKEPNQLIRAGALRVLSSIRVRMISPIVMLAIRDASSDMSPYVRKTAAHAIPKLYALDVELKAELVAIIQKLLADKTVLVIGSAVMAFTEVCPERVDLVHQVYRKLCALLVDVDEWGQAQGEDSDRSFYESASEEAAEKPPPALDPDHRLLLRSTRPLLQSRNAAVVMSVAQLYHHAAPKAESLLASKALIRLLRSHVEVQSVVLNAIASISASNKPMFEPYLKSFFVRVSDPTNVKLLKLDILTNLTTDANVPLILRELQTYIANSDKRFVAATIQAIGRCACAINEVTDSCLSGLVSLLSNRDEAVVAESVVVIKRLLQTQAADPKEIIAHMARLLDTITVAQARAAILWLLGEHAPKVPHIAPDVLRKLAKSFAEEHDTVKLQVMNLAVKLYITDPEKTSLLCQYIFNLARYDQNYDIRDKARLLKQFIPNQDGVLAEQAERIFLASKPAPIHHAQGKDREELQLGSLSHYIKQRASGYEQLPPFPSQQPPGHLRNVEPIPVAEEAVKHHKRVEKAKDMFLWESESSPNSSSGSGGESGSEESSSESESETSSGSGSSTESSEEAEEEEEEEEGEEEVKEQTKVQQFVGKSNLDLLLDLSDAIDNCVPVLTPSMGGFLTPHQPRAGFEAMSARFTNTRCFELINRINGRGLSATYRFTRSPHILSPAMVSVNLVFTNHTNEEICDVRVGRRQLGADMGMHEFGNIARLGPNGSLPATLGLDFNDSTQAANFEIVCSLGNYSVAVRPSIGELVRPVRMDGNAFGERVLKLGGMNEHVGVVKSACGDLGGRLEEVANLGLCEHSDPDNLRFAGQTLKSSNLVLVTLVKNETVKVNCENMVFGSVLLNELLQNLKS